MEIEIDVSHWPPKNQEGINRHIFVIFTWFNFNQFAFRLMEFGVFSDRCSYKVLLECLILGEKNTFSGKYFKT